MEKEYIQLPALKRDLDPDVVKVLWAFIQLPEEYQARYQEQYELLNQRKEEADRQLQENIEKIDADAIHLYEETMRSMIRDIVQQSCNLACWVRYHKYEFGRISGGDDRPAATCCKIYYCNEYTYG